VNDKPQGPHLQTVLFAKVDAEGLRKIPEVLPGATC
jgi:hypothetical protein